MPETLKQFSARYLRIHDESAQDVLKRVLRREADFCINFAGAENLEIEFEPVQVEHYVVVMAHDHRLAGSKILSWKDALDERYISLAKSSGKRRLIDAALVGSGKHPVIFCEVNHVAGVLALSVLPWREDGLVAVPLVNPESKRTLGLISKRGHRMALAASALFEMQRSTLTRPAQGRV